MEWIDIMDFRIYKLFLFNSTLFPLWKAEGFRWRINWGKSPNSLDLKASTSSLDRSDSWLYINWSWIPWLWFWFMVFWKHDETPEVIWFACVVDPWPKKVVGWGCGTFDEPNTDGTDWVGWEKFEFDCGEAKWNEDKGALFDAFSKTSIVPDESCEEAGTAKLKFPRELEDCWWDWERPPNAGAGAALRAPPKIELPCIVVWACVATGKIDAAWGNGVSVKDFWKWDE